MAHPPQAAPLPQGAAQSSDPEAVGIPPDALAAFRIFLGRKPNPDNLPQHDGPHDLNRILARSAEFQRSHRALKTRIGWPLAQVFVSKPARVIYCPIGKNACTFLKSEIASTAGLPHTGYMQRDIHFITDHVRTGLQLSDYTEDQIERLINARQYFKFAVLREPADRLLSAYIEKFVMGRNEAANIHHTKSVVAPVQSVQGLMPPDFDRGITFRQFVEFIARANSEKLDPHWRPQAHYLAGIAYDRLFRIDQLDALMDILEDRSGMSLGRQARNVTGSGKGTAREGAMDLLPARIAAMPRVAKASFFDDDLQALVRQVFADDFVLFEQT